MLAPSEVGGVASECATPIPSARTLVGNWSAYNVAAEPAVAGREDDADHQATEGDRQSQLGSPGLAVAEVKPEYSLVSVGPRAEGQGEAGRSSQRGGWCALVRGGSAPAPPWHRGRPRELVGRPAGGCGRRRRPGRRRGAFGWRGGARSEAVRHLAPAVWGLPVEAPEEAGEVVADGAARQAAWVLAGSSEPPAWALAGVRDIQRRGRVTRPGALRGGGRRRSRPLDGWFGLGGPHGVGHDGCQPGQLASLWNASPPSWSLYS